MVVCAWYENGQCTHSANLNTKCGTKNPDFRSNRCDKIHLVGYRKPIETIEFQMICKMCGEKVSKNIFKKNFSYYRDAADRGVVVCCGCQRKRWNDVVPFSRDFEWTEALLAEWQLKWARQAEFEDFMYTHSELTLNQDPEDFL